MGWTDDDERLTAELPTAHAVVLRMHHSGADDAQVAAALGVDESDVAVLLAIAERKLVELRLR